jgi:hypothetical protein
MARCRQGTHAATILISGRAIGNAVAALAYAGITRAAALGPAPPMTHESCMPLRCLQVRICGPDGGHISDGNARKNIFH